MLILGRSLGDSIVINDNIRIKIYETSESGNKFKIAIEAPKDVRVMRGELYDRLHPQSADQRERA